MWVAVLLIVSACSGGGGGGGSTAPSDTGGPASDDPQADDPQAMVPVSAPENALPGTPPTEDGNTPATPPDDVPVVELPVTGPADVPEETLDPMQDPTPEPAAASRAQVIIAEQGPAIGIPGSRLLDLNEVVVSDAGQITFAGAFQQDTEQGSAVWTGAIDDPKLLTRTGEPVGGVPANVRFGDVRDIDMASDASIGIVAELGGASTLGAYLETRNGQLVSVLRGNDELNSAFDGVVTIESIQSASRSAAGAVIDAITRDTNIRSLWRWDGVSLTQVVKVGSFRRVPAPRLPASCRFHATGNYGITDSGAIVFGAQLFAEPFDPACNKRAILQQVNDVFSEVVAVGDPVPGAPDSTFASVSLRRVAANGDLIVEATVNTPTGAGTGDTRLAFFVFPAAGIPRLIALAGEELQFGNSVEPLPAGADDFSFVYQRGRIAMLVATEENNTFAIVGGEPHPGQPHPDLPAPGASALSFVAGTRGAPPAGFAATNFFSSFGTPATSNAQGYLFPASLTESTPGGETLTALWLADAAGGITPVVQVGEEVLVSGVPQAVSAVASQVGYGFTNQAFVLPTVTDSGDIVFAGQLAGRGTALIYVPSDAP